MVHQLELITDLLGTPSPEVIAKVRRKYLVAFCGLVLCPLCVLCCCAWAGS